MPAPTNGLLTDLYQLNMLQAYLEHGQTGSAVFEFSVRKLPPRRAFLLAAGLEQVLDFLEQLHFSSEDLAWLSASGRFGTGLIDYLAAFRFSGDVHAVPEGTAFFPDEPILRITAPLPQAQLIEPRIMNHLQFQSMVASKAARMVLAAPGKLLVDFGLRRAHSGEAGLLAARASYIAGFNGTATVLAQKQFGIPIFGTMAHSFIEIHDDESLAFERFARARPDNVIFLIDTYDTEAAARKVVALAPKLAAEGIKVRGVRLDSGDLIALARSVRGILDAGGLADVTILVSGGIDEDELHKLVQSGAPIAGFGIGTSLVTSQDAPTLDCVYKLQEYAGLGRRKRSAGKATWPGRKQVWRRFGADGRMLGDILSLEDDHQPGELQLRQVMKDGRRIGPLPELADIRAHAARELARLPDDLRELTPATAYPVEVADALRKLAGEVDRRLSPLPPPLAGIGG